MDLNVIAKIEKEQFQYLKMVKVKICRGRESQLSVSCQVVICFPT